MSSIDEWMKFMWLRTSCLLSSPFGKRIVIRYIIVKNCHAGFLTCIRNGKIFCKYCSRISSVRCMEHLSKQADKNKSIWMVYAWTTNETYLSGGRNKFLRFINSGSRTFLFIVKVLIMISSYTYETMKSTIRYLKIYLVDQNLHVYHIVNDETSINEYCGSKVVQRPQNAITFLVSQPY